ncbi:MAG: thiol reductant ABC exporter subunit CydC [Streptosporangiaceae bacterium]
MTRAGSEQRVAEVRPGRGRDSEREVAHGLLAVTLGAAGQLSGLGLLATSAWLITTSSLRPPILTLTVAIAAVRLFALLRGLGRYGERLASHDVALRILARVRVWAYCRLETLVPGGLGASSAGDVLSRLVADVDAAQDLVVSAAVPLTTGLVTGAAAVALSALLLPETGPVLGTGLVLAAVGVPIIARHRGRHAAGALAAERGRLAGMVVETIDGAADVVAFGATAEALAALDRSEARLAGALRRGAGVAGAATGLATMIGGATTIGVIALGVEALGRGGGTHVSAVMVAVLGFVSLAAFDAVSTLPDVFARLDAAVSSARRVHAIADLASPVVDPPRPRPVPTGEPALALEHVSVSYAPGGAAALDGVNLSVAAGETVAIVGPSGAGKTTLALALLRFVECSAGRITLGGVDVRDLAADDVRARIAWAPQDPHVFATTVAANLRLARPSATDADLAAVLEALGLGGWLAGLPDGLSSELGGRGLSVSGGERQRIGLARALLADRPLLVLDEPTAHLDEAGEAVVRGAVFRRAEGRSLVWITHRLVGLEDFDQVAVLDAGRVVEHGQARALARRAGPYAGLLTDAAAAQPGVRRLRQLR